MGQSAASPAPLRCSGLLLWQDGIAAEAKKTDGAAEPRQIEMKVQLVHILREANEVSLHREQQDLEMMAEKEKLETVKERVIRIVEMIRQLHAESGSVGRQVREGTTGSRSTPGQKIIIIEDYGRKQS